MLFITDTHKYVTQWPDHHQSSHHRQSSRKSNSFYFCRRYLSATHFTLVDEAAGRKHSSSAASAPTAESSVCFTGEGGGGRHWHVLNREHMVRQDNILATRQPNTMCASEHQNSRPNFSYSTRNPPLAMKSQVRDGSHS